MVGSTMLLSVFMPHSGRDEGDYIEALDMVRATLTEGRKAGAVDFFIGGDINTELRLASREEDLHGPDSIEWYGLYGPECRGGVRTSLPMKRRYVGCKFLRGFNCTVTSIWTNNDGETGRSCVRGQSHYDSFAGQE